MKNEKTLAIFLLMVLTLICGSSFILIKKGLTAFSPGQVGSLRIVISGIIFLPYVLLNLKKINPGKLMPIFWFGLTEIGIPPYLYSIAQTSIPSSTAGILNSLVPLFTLLIGVLFFHQRTDWARITGVFIGLAGAVFLVFSRTAPGSGVALDFSNGLGLLIVFATILYGIGGNVLQKSLNDVPGVMIAALAFVGMSIPAGIYLSFTGSSPFDFSVSTNLHAFLAISALSVFGSALAIYLFSIVVKKSDALFASFVTYLIPFVALGWGVLDGESLNILHFICLLCILSGIYLANKRKKPAAVKK